VKQVEDLNVLSLTNTVVTHNVYFICLGRVPPSLAAKKNRQILIIKCGIFVLW